MSLGRTLITGGTGYFGRAFTRFLLESDVMATVCIYSRGEYEQHLVAKELERYAERMRFFIGDVRDMRRLQRAMEGCHYVVHAAALKRVEVGEYNPEEMVKTNVLGAMNVIEAARRAAVGRVLAISSDKACEPLNAYGATKLVMEKLFTAANESSGAAAPRFACTRYGNVMGSRGSVVPTWRAAIRDGRRINLTDPEATRFLMTIGQACQFVANALWSMKGGELFVPTLGSYCMGDLAYVVLGNAWPDVVNITGLGAGEKRHERMNEGGPSSYEAPRVSMEELRAAVEGM